MKKYTIEQLEEERIGVLLPTKEDYKIFMYFIKSNDIPYESFEEDEWERYNKNSCMSHHTFGFTIHNKKNKNRLKIKKFIRLEQLIMRDTEKKQQEKIEKGFASVDEFMYYMISNNILEKRNILGTPSTLDESIIKTFDKFVEIGGVASNYNSIDNFYPSKDLTIEIEFTNGESGTIVYKLEKTRDSDYQKLLQSKWNHHNISEGINNGQ